jgi:hypothetical protein
MTHGLCLIGQLLNVVLPEVSVSKVIKRFDVRRGF